ncbi:MAG TPA: helix-turn-helix domain-containing protein [Polyangiaceae bacterium]|jgi:DNA-binding MarR family transcriptional regulator
MVDSKREAQLNETLELFHFAFRAFTAKPDKVLAARGLARVHHRILYFVARNPNLTVSALLSILAVTKQALNAPLRQLVEMGLVESRTAHDDRRQRLLRLTLEGEQLERALSGAQRKKMANAFERLGPDAERYWRLVMAKVAEER